MKDILVFLDGSAHATARLEAAAGLAVSLSAGLVGLRVEMRPRLPNAIRAEIPESYLELRRQAVAVATARIEAEFQAVAARSGLPSEWWVEQAASGVDAVCWRARHACLTVVGAPAADGDEELPAEDLLHRLVLESGRPVLVVPDLPALAPLGRRVVVAWNGTRESSRALADALPILAGAEHTTVVAVLGKGDAGDAGVAEVSRHLRRNGVVAEALVLRSDDHDAGRAIMEQATSSGADLVVMGAYGRSRMREVILGGATRHILAHTRLPVLMAH